MGSRAPRSSSSNYSISQPDEKVNSKTKENSSKTETEEKDENYVYSFSAEAQEGSSTPQTLHAVVNGDNEVTANAQPSNNIIRQEDEKVNSKTKENSSKT